MALGNCYVTVDTGRIPMTVNVMTWGCEVSAFSNVWLREFRTCWNHIHMQRRMLFDFPTSFATLCLVECVGPPDYRPRFCLWSAPGRRRAVDRRRGHREHSD